MRIVAGKFRSRLIQAPKGDQTRPTLDKVKEAVFSRIGPYFDGGIMLDLFAGSGQIGLEAISRGALYAVFIENNRKAAKCIEDNIAFTKFTKESRLLTTDVISGISSLEGKYTFDIIFMDPPYDRLFEKKVLDRLYGSVLIHEETLIVVEASLKTDFSYIEDSGYKIIREKRYKTNKHLFLTIK